MKQNLLEQQQKIVKPWMLVIQVKKVKIVC